MIRDAMKRAIRQYLRDNGVLDEYTARVANLAEYDLYFGPLTLDDGTEDADFTKLLAGGLVDECANLNFSACIDFLRNADFPGALYYFPEWDGVSETEPEGVTVETGEIDDDGNLIREWCEPAPYYVITGRDLLRLVFGETANYL